MKRAQLSLKKTHYYSKGSLEDRLANVEGKLDSIIEDAKKLAGKLDHIIKDAKSARRVDDYCWYANTLSGT
jgi:hypothetical protein